MNKSDVKEMIMHIIEIEEQFSYSIEQVVREWCKHHGKQDPIAELPHNQAHVALGISRLGACSLSDAARMLKMSKSSASQMVQRLVEKGILIRREDPDNRRKVLIEVEPDVKIRFDEIDKHIQIWLRKVADKLGERSFMQWYRIMGKLGEILKSEEVEV